ncbi:MAG: alpha/beta hydrolase [Deltaproteobacteria bacterium]|nr:alpha/beta hydrolase [Deltaproteobacteria bacterium]
MTDFFKEGDGASIIFLPGFGLGLNSFNPLINILKKSFTCYVFDYSQRGINIFNDGSTLTVRFFADELDNFIIDNKIHNSPIIAHSFGGFVALDYVSNYSDSAGPLILIGSGISGKNIKHPFLKKGRLETVVNQNLKASVFENFYSDYTDDFKNYANDLSADITRNFKRPSYLKAIQDLAMSFSIENHIENIKSKVMIIHGKEDSIIKIDNATEMNKKIKTSHLVVLNQCGHLPQLEKPVECSDHIKQFLTII